MPVCAALARCGRDGFNEEQDILPRVSKVWNEDRLEQAGREMTAMKAKKLKPTTGRRAA
jgi:hypothetical protein